MKKSLPIIISNGWSYGGHERSQRSGEVVVFERKIISTYVDKFFYIFDTNNAVSSYAGER